MAATGSPRIISFAWFVKIPSARDCSSPAPSSGSTSPWTTVRAGRPFQLDLPVTPITDMAVKRGDLVVATQGRSFWILDDLSPLRQMTADVLGGDFHLFAPRDVIRWADGSGGRRGPGGGAEGKNPPFGAMIHYLLPEADDGDDAVEVRLEILDADGEVLRSMSSTKPEKQAPNIWRKLFPELFEPPKLDAREGANRWVWNLRLPDADHRR